MKIIKLSIVVMSMAIFTVSASDNDQDEEISRPLLKISSENISRPVVKTSKLVSISTPDLKSTNEPITFDQTQIEETPAVLLDE